ncbi:hypothetical protein GLAREA_11935 [Glarea lozoyensis ATCC 20868]|uniref:HCNGP-domain-containing protein n=1 Tax=Glarea lozoyensis (strain ATCC 20868 / MF5171) TaxID=1116229 RepID=S3DZX8_GLAL2|nr:uncharacterized protein GLAREA_11935 [Glarea lozoyensis ATCC 20868]EPE31853.1 hypothetical protein GLAREA_11935 [Glarea lozoyensis ATCC 20868]
MALVGYGSSDEEEDIVEEIQKQVPLVAPASRSSEPASSHKEIQSNGSLNPEKKVVDDATNPHQDSVPADDAPVVGPIQGPSIPTMDAEMNGLQEEEDGISGPPQSPYSANRALLRDLTLPSLPSYDIPPSPPGSPVASTNAKFKHFLDLKKKGIHFNEKLSKSAAMKNPALMQKLMDFSDIDEIGQYSTTLPKEIWNPRAFPETAFKEELAKSQKKILKRKEEERLRGQRGAVDFVPAAVTTEPSSRSGTPGGKGPKSAAERIMAGLDSDRGRSNSPQVQGVKRKGRFDT